MWRPDVKLSSGQVITRIAGIAFIGFGVFGVVSALRNLLGY